MSSAVYFLVVLHAVLMGVWFVAQQALFSRGAAPEFVMSLSGLGAIVLIVASVIKRGRFVPKIAWSWYTATGLLNIIIAECLTRATARYGAALGANAMGLAPGVAVIAGWLLLRETPGRWGLLGITMILGGVYIDITS